MTDLFLGINPLVPNVVYIRNLHFYTPNISKKLGILSNAVYLFSNLGIFTICQDESPKTYNYPSVLLWWIQFNNPLESLCTHDQILKALTYFGYRNLCCLSICLHCLQLTHLFCDIGYFHLF